MGEIVNEVPLDLSAPAWVSGFPALSLVTAVFLGGAVMVVWLFRHRVSLRARAKAENAHAHAQLPFVSGRAQSVRGKVVAADAGPSPPVRIEIRQAARNHTNKNNKWYTWEEEGPRVVTARPFLLEREGAEPVRVEPGEHVFLIDALETVPNPTRATRRSRVSELSFGEEVSVYGVLRLEPSASGRAASAYRGASMGWVLSPPEGERMVLASQSLATRYARRIAFLLHAGILCAFLWFAVNAVVTFPFLAATAFGKQEMAHIVGQRTWITKSKSSTTTHQAIAVETADAYAFEGEVDAKAYAYFEQARARDPNVRVPTTQAFHWSWASFVGAPQVSVPGSVLALVLGVVLAMIGSVQYAKKLAWYDRPELSEEGGAGHLSD